MSSKYVDAINAIGQPSSPQQIREKVMDSDTNQNINSQNIASSLYDLRRRGKIIRLDNGLYVTHKIIKK